MSGGEFTHLDREGRPRMVDVGDKAPSRRRAVAEGTIVMNPQTAEAIEAGRTAKGNVLTVAEIAGISAAKKTSDLIPLCHPIALSSVALSLEVDAALPGVRAVAT